jgi:hypothetical protein
LQHLPATRRVEEAAIREAPVDRVEREVELIGSSHLRLHEAWGTPQVSLRARAK